jgi:hypothetical protein
MVKPYRLLRNGEYFFFLCVQTPRSWLGDTRQWGHMERVYMHVLQLATRLRTLVLLFHVLILLALHDFFYIYIYISVLQIFFLLHTAVPRLSFLII